MRSAPTFSRVAEEVRERLSDCVFVAHNARFDHGFLKHEFLRVGVPFSPRVLCTVRLSRRLDPEKSVFKNDASRWRDTEKLSRLEKDIRRRLAIDDVFRRNDDVEEISKPR